MTSSSSTFAQDAPHLGNQFEEDLLLRKTLQELFANDPAIYSQACEELFDLGKTVVDLIPLARVLDVQTPRLIQYDSWGNRVDQLEIHENWKKMKDVAAQHGVIADGYDLGKWKSSRNARIVQFMKLYLYAPSSGLFSCPLAMTDGCAKALKLNKTHTSIYNRLTSRDPSVFITSGQWMTEKKGGSDVSNGTETIAVKLPDGSFALTGYKWFSSATDSDVSLTLGRIGGDKSPISCFLVRVRDEHGKLNNITIPKLKNKLGTKQLPTSELQLNGTRAELVGEEGAGVRFITSTMVNITRLHNSISACSGMRRILALMRDYAHRRVVFKKTLSEHDLHLKTLAELEIKRKACFLFCLDAIERFGISEDEQNEESDNSQLARFLIPILKAFTAKIAIQIASEGLESFGGQGYIEDTGLPVHLRDAQVLSIWEGTTNVMSLDVLRVLMKSKGEAFKQFVRQVSETGIEIKKHSPKLNQLNEDLKQRVLVLIQRVEEGTMMQERLAREFCFYLGNIYCASLLIKEAGRETTNAVETSYFMAKKWVQENCIMPAVFFNSPGENENEAQLIRSIALAYDENGKPTGCGNVGANGVLRSKY